MLWHVRVKRDLSSLLVSIGLIKLVLKVNFAKQEIKFNTNAIQ